MNFKALETKQKLRGGYYTPEDLANFLVRWVAGCAPTSILEPSCGDGVFLARIAALAGESSVTAFEVDPDEAHKARTRVGDESDVCAADFLGWALSALQRQNTQFDAVVGNPPFIRYQYLPSDFQERAEGIFKVLGCRFTRHTNAWVPFVLASFAMLREGGRLAMVVPAEIIHVAHAQPLRSYLVANAKKLVVVDPAELWFPGTLQGAVLLMAEKRSVNDAAAGVGIESVCGRAFTKTHPQDLFNASSAVNQGDGSAKWTYALLSDSVRSLLDDLSRREGVSRFGELADVDVGIVTGANQFFHVPDSTVQKYGLHQWAHPMFGRSAHCPGVVYDQAQHEANANKGNPTNFVWFRDDSVRESPSGREYIEHGERDQLHRRYKCRIREPWYAVPSVYATDVGLLKRCHDAPRLVLNSLGAYTTDTAYRIRVRRGSADRLVYNFINAITALSAELEGRHYGGGVLELVPSEIERLLVPDPPDLSVDIAGLDRAVKAESLGTVLERQSRLVLGALGMGCANQDDLISAWGKLRDRRRRLSATAPS